MNILEFVQIRKPEEVLIEVVSGFQSINSGIVHIKMCDIVLKWKFTSPESKHLFFKKFGQISIPSVNQRWVDIFG